MFQNFNKSSTDIVFKIDNGLSNCISDIFLLGFGFCLGFFGLLANILNMVVFFKQGFSETINISFFTLAIADGGCSAATLWRSVCFNRTMQVGLLMNLDFFYLTTIVSRTLFVRFGCWIKTFISLERCLCIVMPLKIKHFVTPFKTGVIMVIIFVIVALGMFPFAIILPKHYKYLKTTVFARAFKAEDRQLEQIASACSLFIQFTPLILETVSTLMMIRSLKVISKWRKETLPNLSVQNVLSSRNKKLIKLVTLMCAIFIACSIPTSINSIAWTALSKSFVIEDRYYDVFKITFSLTTTMDVFNSAISIFIYYTMSAKFKEDLTEVILRIKQSCF